MTITSVPTTMAVRTDAPAPWERQRIILENFRQHMIRGRQRFVTPGAMDTWPLLHAIRRRRHFSSELVLKF